MIRVVEHFLDKNEIHKLNSLVSDFKWTYGENSGTSSQSIFFWSANLMNESFFTKTVFNKIQSHFKMNFELLKVYANGQTYGLDGSFHKDNEHDDYYTFLLYLSFVSLENVDDFGGYTQFKINNIVHNVEPLFNRGVLFSSNIIHRGLAPSRLCNDLRVSVAYKMKLAN